MTAPGRMTGKRWGGIVAVLALGLAAPADAQNSDAPVDVTAAPPPSAETVGPSQLRDFNLRGTVTRPADQPASSPSQPASVAPAQPRAGEAVPSEAAQPVATSSQAPRVTNSAARTVPTSAEPQLPAGGTITPSLPLDVVTGSAVDQATEVPDLSAPVGDAEASWSWPWIAALLALLAGGLYLGWSKLGRRQRYADPGRMAFAGLVPDDVGTAAPPPRAPRPDPVPPRAQPAPRPDPVPRPAPPRAADDGLIVSTALKPKLALQFTPDRAVVTDREVLLQFDVLLSNGGTAPARDVLVEAKLLTAHAGQDSEIAAFFQQPLGKGDRMAGIPPMGKVSLKSAVRLPLSQVHSFEVDGRRLFVPMVAFNVLFRAGSVEEQASASYLVGRGSEEDEKLAPFRLDLGPRVFRGLSARPHSLGLQPA